MVEKHFKFLCESLSCVCGIIQNIIMSNPTELGDMREDPAEEIKNLMKNRIKETDYHI